MKRCSHLPSNLRVVGQVRSLSEPCASVSPSICCPCLPFLHLPGTLGSSPTALPRPQPQGLCGYSSPFKEYPLPSFSSHQLSIRCHLLRQSALTSGIVSTRLWIYSISFFFPSLFFFFLVCLAPAAGGPPSTMSAHSRGWAAAAVRVSQC